MFGDVGAGIIGDRIARYGIGADLCQGYGYPAYNARQVKTLRTWEQEFTSVGPDEDIELLTRPEVKTIIGSDVSVIEHRFSSSS